MLKKIYQADFLLLPEQEFWHMYVLLRKGKASTMNALEDLPKNHQMRKVSMTMNMPVSR